MVQIKKILNFVRKGLEEYIPTVMFCLMFCTFILQIFCRYVLNDPLAWAYEVQVSSYLWLVILGACYAQRDRSHVTFTMLTDLMPTRLQAFCTFLGNFLILSAFAISFVPSVKFIAFMARQETSILKIGLNVIYCPYIVFLVLMCYYMLRDVILDFKVFTGLATEAEVNTYRHDNMNEVEQALEDAKEGVTRL